jgi:hypothetical protein
MAGCTLILFYTLCVAKFSSNQYSSGSAVVSDLIIIGSGCVDGSALAMLSARHVARSGLVMLNTRYVADSDLACSIQDVLLVQI